MTSFEGNIDQEFLAIMDQLVEKEILRASFGIQIKMTNVYQKKELHYHRMDIQVFLLINFR